MIYEGTNTLAIPPGETIKELLTEQGMNQKEFAKRMGLSEKHVSHLINGKVHLTIDVAVDLEYVLGPSAKFWMSLEANYQEDLLKAKTENSIEEIKLLKQFAYSDMARKGLVPKSKIEAEQIINLKKYYKVANLKTVSEL